MAYRASNIWIYFNFQGLQESLESIQSKLREQRGLYDIFALEKHKYKQVRQTAANLFEQKKSRKEIKKKYTFLKIYA